MDLLNIIYLGVPFLASCLAIQTYIEGKFAITRNSKSTEENVQRKVRTYLHDLRASSGIENILRDLLSYEKLWYFDKDGITLFTTLFYLIGATLFFIIKFYVNPPASNCIDIYYPFPQTFCNEPTVYGQAFRGFCLGGLFAFISYILIIIIISNFYRKIEYKVRCLNPEEKEELQEIIKNSDWRYEEAKKEFEELLRNILNKLGG
jgi:hypothetical protein